MPIDLATVAGAPRLQLTGVIPPEEVDQLHELIRDNPEAAADLSACEHLHTSALQLLLMLKIPVISLPEDPFWGHFFSLQEVARHEDDPAG